MWETLTALYTALMKSANASERQLLEELPRWVVAIALRRLMKQSEEFYLSESVPS